MQAISREALPLPATPKGVTTRGQRNLLLFILKGPRLKKNSVINYSTLGFQEYGMANASNLSRGFTPASNLERGNNTWATKLAFIYVKRAKAKNSVISYLRVPRVRNGLCEALPLPATPKGVTTYGQRNGLFTLGYTEYGTTLWVGLTKSSKAPRVKPRVRNDQCKQFYKRYLSPARKPK